ncbi:hypothetical protein A7K93_10505 [Candidatus Methylacidiphilum fumarolicum]|nr:hypothetical protein A7K93_10505 [Candidatus Methylacidiphilum fumarolicum]
MHLRVFMPSGENSALEASRLGLGEMGEGPRLRLSGIESVVYRKEQTGTKPCVEQEALAG